MKSKELLKNICRTLKEFNKLLDRSYIFIVVSPQTGETQLKISSDIMSSSISLDRLMHTVIMLMNSLDILKATTPILLYTCNLITQAQMKNTLKNNIRKCFYGLDKEYSRLSEIYEIIPLVNSQYINQNSSNIEEYCANFNQVVALYYKQLHKSPFKDHLLFSFPPLFSDGPLMNI